jgi:hypothetical protein
MSEAYMDTIIIVKISIRLFNNNIYYYFYHYYYTLIPALKC